MKVYMLNSGRPIGMSPQIFLSVPKLCECGGGNCNPWCPTLTDFDSLFDAMAYMAKYYPMHVLEIVP